MTDECIFCKIVSGDLPANVVYRDDEVVAFEDIKPIAPVHLLIIPTRHIPSVRELAEDDGPVLKTLVDTANRLARERRSTTRASASTSTPAPTGARPSTTCTCT